MACHDDSLDHKDAGTDASGVVDAGGEPLDGDGGGGDAGGPLAIPTPSLPAGVRQVAYAATLEATGGFPPYTWSIAGGALPAGLTLDAATGAVAGLPSVGARTGSFAVTVTDAEGSTQTKVYVVPVTPTASWTCSGTAVSPGDDVATLVSTAPAGTTFCFAGGVYHGVSVAPKAGDVFSSLHGTTADNVVLDGADPLASWTAVTIGGVSYWTTAGGAALYSTQSSRVCEAVNPGCYLSQDLFVDSTLYTHPITLTGLAAGSWYHEVLGLTSVAVKAAGTGYAVGDVLAVQGGTGGTVRVASITGTAVTGPVATVTIATTGTAYPAGTSTATTTDTAPGTGTGCTLTIAGGSGGTMNNVYLVASEQPNSHTVELSALQAAFSGNVPDVTIQGLVIERYGPALQSGAIRAGAGTETAGSMSASGWLVQNNEIRFNHGGISFTHGADDWQVVNNNIHHDGTVGMGAGGTEVGFFVGNTMAYGNQDHENCGFECVFKVTGSDDCSVDDHLFIANNLVQNNHGNGLWSDVCARYVTYDRNVIMNNDGEGIRVEISDFNTVTNNTLTNNGATAIVCTECSQTRIGHNDITFVKPATGSTGALELSHDTSRDGEHVGYTVPVNVAITDNAVTVADETYVAKVADESKVVVSDWIEPGMYDRNTYCVGPAVSAWTGTSGYMGWRLTTIPSDAPPPYEASVNFAAWQKSGQDPDGVLLPAGACPRASSP